MAITAAAMTRMSGRRLKHWCVVACTCVFAFQLIASVESQKKNIHDHEFRDAKNPLAVPVIVPRLVHVSEGDVPVIVYACVQIKWAEKCVSDICDLIQNLIRITTSTHREHWLRWAVTLRRADGPRKNSE
jgi:hypothetical protein